VRWRWSARFSIHAIGQKMTDTILVTGGAGFIGSNFVHYVMENMPGARVIVLDALTYAGSIENLPEASLREEDDRVLFRYGNVMNADLVDALVSESSHIVHFAAETHVTRSIYDNKQFFETDVLGTQVIANAVLRHRKTVKRFIHISTSEVYGTAVSPLMDENHPLNPMSPYASAKCGADRLVYSYWQTYDLPITIIRPFNNYGPRQHLEKAVPRFITSAILGEPLTVHGDGSAARDFVFVEDVCRAVGTVLNAPAGKVTGEVFNVGTGEHKTVLDIAKDVLRVMGKPEDQIVFVGDRPGQVFRHTGGANKIKTTLGWQPRVSWEDGIKRTVDWFINNEAFWRKQIWMRKIPIITSSGKVELH